MNIALLVVRNPNTQRYFRFSSFKWSRWLSIEFVVILYEDIPSHVEERWGLKCKGCWISYRPVIECSIRRKEADSSEEGQILSIIKNHYYHSMHFIYKTLSSFDKVFHFLPFFWRVSFNIVGWNVLNIFYDRFLWFLSVNNCPVHAAIHQNSNGKDTQNIPFIRINTWERL